MSSAAINLVTGAPGAGKTLWTIGEVEKLRQETGRPVVYHRIPELKLDWQELKEPKDWYNQQPGTIIVTDEAHKVFPQRPAGTQAPAHVAPYDELRHRGLTVFLLTQHPTELDHYIRRRVGRHVHFERKFGVERSRKFEWQRLSENTQDYHERQEAMRSEFRFPKETYALYKSADVHTIQKRLPWGKFLAIGGAAACVVGLGVFGVQSVIGGKDKPVVGVDHYSGLPVVGKRTGPITDPKKDAPAWSTQFAPRVLSAPYSARFYDATLVPASFPKIAGCLEITVNHRTDCKCNTQQGTIITSMSIEQCQFYRRNGWFDFAKADVEEEPQGAGGPNPEEGGSASDGGSAPVPEPVARDSSGVGA